MGLCAWIQPWQSPVQAAALSDAPSLPAEISPDQPPPAKRPDTKKSPAKAKKPAARPDEEVQPSRGTKLFPDTDGSPEMREFFVHQELQLNVLRKTESLNQSLTLEISELQKRLAESESLRFDSLIEKQTLRREVASKRIEQLEQQVPPRLKH